MRLALLAFLTAAIVSCSHPPPDATPAGALQTWLEMMETTTQTSDPRDVRAAYALLSKTTHQSLEKRAERASRIEGRRVEGYDVLAQGRFALRFRPKHFTTAIAGEGATVDVTGDEPTDRATLHCSKEGAVWRVDLALPELGELPRRQESP